MNKPLIIFIFFLLSCSSNQDNKTVNRKIKLVPSISAQDPKLHLNHTYINKTIIDMGLDCDCYHEFNFNSLYSDGLKVKDTIIFAHSNCMMQGTTLRIKLYKDSVELSAHLYSCTYHKTYSPLHYFINLKEQKTNIGDTVEGYLEYSGFFYGKFHDNDPKSISDTVDIKGFFKYVIKEERECFFCPPIKTLSED